MANVRLDKADFDVSKVTFVPGKAGSGYVNLLFRNQKFCIQSSIGRTPFGYGFNPQYNSASIQVNEDPLEESSVRFFNNLRAIDELARKYAIDEKLYQQVTNIKKLKIEKQQIEAANATFGTAVKQDDAKKWPPFVRVKVPLVKGTQDPSDACEAFRLDIVDGKMTQTKMDIRDIQRDSKVILLFTVSVFANANFFGLTLSLKQVLLVESAEQLSIDCDDLGVATVAPAAPADAPVPAASSNAMDEDDVEDDEDDGDGDGEDAFED